MQLKIETVNNSMKSTFKITFYSLLFSFAYVTPLLAQQKEGDTINYKPRVINTTDLGADPDDEQSMVRQLVSANEFDIEGLIVSTGCWKKSQSNTDMLDKLVDAYAQAYPNLKVHADGYPTPEYLRSISVMGQDEYGMGDVGKCRLMQMKCI